MSQALDSLELSEVMELNIHELAKPVDTHEGGMDYMASAHESMSNESPARVLLMKNKYEKELENLAEIAIAGASNRISKNPRRYDSLEESLPEATLRVVKETRILEKMEKPLKILEFSNNRPVWWWILFDSDNSLKDIPEVMALRALQLDVFDVSREIIMNDDGGFFEPPENDAEDSENDNRDGDLDPRRNRDDEDTKRGGLDGMSPAEIRENVSQLEEERKDELVIEPGYSTEKTGLGLYAVKNIAESHAGISKLLRPTKMVPR